MCVCVRESRTLPALRGFPSGVRPHYYFVHEHVQAMQFATFEEKELVRIISEG